MSAGLPQAPPLASAALAPTASATASAALPASAPATISVEPAAVAVPSSARGSRWRLGLRPTRYAPTFAIVLLFMWMGAISYQSNAAWLLVFIVAAAGAVSILHARRNLVGVDAVLLPIAVGTAGQISTVPALLCNRSRSPAYGIELVLDLDGLDSASLWVAALPAGAALTVHIPVPVVRAGVHAVRDLRLRSVWPLGLVVATGPGRCEPGSELLVAPAPLRRDVAHHHAGDDRDFAGHQRWRPGMPPARLDWKAAARGRPGLAKDFADTPGNRERWLDWETCDPGDTPSDEPASEAAPALNADSALRERRLGRLAGALADSIADDVAVGLRLPGEVLPPRRGQAHLLAGRIALARCAARLRRSASSRLLVASERS